MLHRDDGGQRIDHRPGRKVDGLKKMSTFCHFLKNA